MFRSLLILALPLAFLAAQEGADPAKPQKGARQERIIAHLHRLRTERLQQALGLSEERAKAIADRWTRHDRDAHAQRQALRKIHRQVNEILLSALPEEEKNSRIRPLVEQSSALRRQQYEENRRFEEEIATTLTPAEQARFLLLVEEMQRSLVEAIRQQKQGNP